MVFNFINDLIYIVFRLIRRVIPDKLFTMMLVNNVMVKSSFGYADSEKPFLNFKKNLAESGINLKGKRVLELGFGGAMQMGMFYQLDGAEEIYMVDRYAKQKFDLCAPHIQTLLDKYPEHDFGVSIKGERVEYDDTIYRIYFQDLETIKLKDSSIDLILSQSVFEHIGDVGAVVGECSRLLSPEGVFLATIDMSDHFQRYPLHMLKFSEKVWERYLNPPSNLNRLRSRDYEQIFDKNSLKILKKNVYYKNKKLAKEMKPHLDKHFQSYPDEVLSEFVVTYLLTKKGR